MDKSHVYAIMCQTAEEIQKLKKDEIGDFILAHYTEASWQVEVINESTLILYKRHPSSRKTDIWLPRQDQIQELLLGGYAGPIEPWPVKRMLEDISKFYNAVQILDKSKTISIEQVWLMYYMHEIHGKKWDGNDKSWVKS